MNLSITFIHIRKYCMDDSTQNHLADMKKEYKMFKGINLYKKKRIPIGYTNYNYRLVEKEDLKPGLEVIIVETNKMDYIKRS